jgi:hypothetical protein
MDLTYFFHQAKNTIYYEVELSESPISKANKLNKEN